MVALPWNQDGKRWAPTWEWSMRGCVLRRQRWEVGEQVPAGQRFRNVLRFEEAKSNIGNYRRGVRNGTTKMRKKTQS